MIILRMVLVGIGLLVPGFAWAQGSMCHGWEDRPAAMQDDGLWPAAWSWFGETPQQPNARALGPELSFVVPDGDLMEVAREAMVRFGVSIRMGEGIADRDYLVPDPLRVRGNAREVLLQLGNAAGVPLVPVWERYPMEQNDGRFRGGTLRVTTWGNYQVHVPSGESLMLAAALARRAGGVEMERTLEDPWKLRFRAGPGEIRRFREGMDTVNTVEHLVLVDIGLFPVFVGDVGEGGMRDMPAGDLSFVDPGVGAFVTWDEPWDVVESSLMEDLSLGVEDPQLLVIPAGGRVVFHAVPGGCLGAQGDALAVDFVGWTPEQRARLVLVPEGRSLGESLPVEVLPGGVFWVHLESLGRDLWGRLVYRSRS